MVSIVVPAFNAESTILRALNSVKNQTYSNWQLIVVNDYSTDQTATVVQSANFSIGKLILINLPQNSGGPARPRNIGLKHAVGDFVAFLDADDMWFPTKLETQIKNMLRNRILISATRVAVMTGSSPRDITPNVGRIISKPIYKRFDLDRMLLKNPVRSGSSVVVRRDPLIKYGIRFDERRAVVGIEDYIFWLDYVKATNGDLFVFDERLVLYKKSKDSLSSNKLKMIKKIYTLLWERSNNKWSFFIRFCFYSLNSFFRIETKYKC